MALSTRSPGLSLPRQSGGGSIPEVWQLAYPVVLTQLSSTLMGVVDSAMVGRLGPTQLAAVGFGAIWLWTVFSFFYGTGGGVQTFVSQRDGAGRPERCGAWAWTGLFAVFPAAGLVVCAGLPSVDTLLALLGPSSELQASASAYVRMRLPGELGFVVFVVFNSFFRGIGDTRTALYITLSTNALNALLDYGLIFGNLGMPAWGVAGAAAATSIAHWVGALAIFAAYRRPRLRLRYATQLHVPGRGEIRRFLRTGAPMGGQWFLGMTSFAVFTTVVARMGDTSMAASQAFVMLLSISFMQAIGLSVAAQTIVGRYRGAGDPEAVRRGYASSLVLGGCVAVLVAALFVALPGPLLRIFTDDPGVMALGRPLLLVGALFQLFDAMAIISQGALRGAGDTRWPFLVETALGWGVQVPLAYTLGIVCGLGLTGAWAGGCFAIGLLALTLVRRFRSGAWRQIEI